MKNIIEPRLLKGFRDFRGDELRIRKYIFKVFADTFEKYGYEPLETPTLEYFDILMGKYGEEEKLVYQFKDNGDRQVAMKYDLTVPTARVYAQYKNEITLPWKRYQIQPVFRAENTQRGRFREFYQLDADIYGIASPIADAEYIDMGIEILLNLGFKDFNVRINNRKILNAIAIYSGREDKMFDIIYAIDKWDKRSIEETRADLCIRLKNEEFSESEILLQVEKIIECIDLSEINSLEKLSKLKEKLGNIPEGKEGIEELEYIFEITNNSKYIKYDTTIARGLAYYTGPIWEYNIIEGNIGSVGGCGRYDKLVGQFTGESVPATGGSFGIERLLVVMKEKGMLDNILEFKEKFLLIGLDELSLKYSFKIASKIRENGKIVMLYPKVEKLSKIINYATQNNYKYIIIIGENEIKDGIITLKNIETREQKTLTLDELEKYS